MSSQLSNKIHTNFSDYHAMLTLFKYIMCDYIDDETAINILSVNNVEDFGIANLLGVNLRRYNDHALRYSSENGYKDVVQYLVEKGADIHVESGCALISASGNGHFSVVKYLLQKGADIHL